MPDQGTLYATIKAEHKEVAVAREQLAQKVSALLKAVKALDVQGLEISTEDFTLTPLIKPPKGGSVSPGGPGGWPGEYEEVQDVVGYRVSSSIRAVIKGSPEALATGLSRVIDALGKTGSHISGPRFACRDYKAARLEALEKATLDGVENARAIAKGLGRTISDFSYAGLYPQSDSLDPTIGALSGGDDEGVSGPPATPVPIQIRPIPMTFRVYVTAMF